RCPAAGDGDLGVAARRGAHGTLSDDEPVYVGDIARVRGLVRAVHHADRVRVDPWRDRVRHVRAHQVLVARLVAVGHELVDRAHRSSVDEHFHDRAALVLEVVVANLPRIPREPELHERTLARTALAALAHMTAVGLLAAFPALTVGSPIVPAAELGDRGVRTLHLARDYHAVLLAEDNEGTPACLINQCRRRRRRSPGAAAQADYQSAGRGRGTAALDRSGPVRGEAVVQAVGLDAQVDDPRRP